MSGFGHNDEDEKIPFLLPLKKTNKQEAAPLVLATPSEKGSTSDHFANFMNEIGKKPSSQGGATPVQKELFKKKEPNAEKVADIEKKNKEKISNVPKKEANPVRQNEKIKENEKSKFLIAEMLNKISVKNVTEELYPVSNEAIEGLISEVDREIEELRHEAEKKENSLAMNTNNLHMRKQLEAIRREIGHCATIKELYCEKMNSRNKIQILEGQLIDIRFENRDLKLKVSRGIETIEDYKQNLPSDLEKELQEKLNKCTQELNMEREMRQNLEKNIESIIMNFKRLYEEADTARMIVTNKLREVEERERMLARARPAQEEDNSELEGPQTRRVGSLEPQEEKKAAISASYNESYLNETHNQSMNFKKNYDQDATNKKPNTSAKQRSHSGKADEMKDKKGEQKMTLEEKIEKMRNNQYILGRVGQAK